KDEEVAEEEVPPEQEELKDASAGLKDIEGDPNALDPGIVDPGPGTGVVEQKAPEVFTYVEQMPDPGYSVNAYLAKNIKYPPAAKENGISGRVAIKFVVNEDGSISGVQVAGGRRLGGGLEEEAMRVVKTMPAWKPGKQNGRPVKVYYTLPVNFKLE
ncbi:MAG TPA: energy transducer TonB, partial [Flavipsychrobacter sp.]